MYINKTQQLTRNASSLVKQCMSKEVALQYNLLKPNGKRKYALISMPIYKILKGRYILIYN